MERRRQNRLCAAKLFIEPDLPLTVNEFFRLIKSTPWYQKVLAATRFLTTLKCYLKPKNRGFIRRPTAAGPYFWALLGHPDVLLFDEPTAGIDLSSEETIYSLSAQTPTKEKLTIMLISHELQVVYHYADRVIVSTRNRSASARPAGFYKGKIWKKYSDHKSGFTSIMTIMTIRNNINYQFTIINKWSMTKSK